MITSPADLLGMVFDDLTTWAKPRRGVVSLTQNPYDLLEMLGQRPSGWRLTLHWEGDEPADPRLRDVVVVDNRFRFVLDGDLGPTATPKLALIRETAARTPFLAVAAAVRKRVLSYRFPWLAEPNNRLRYDGTDDQIPLPGGGFLAAYNLRFRLYSKIETAEQTVEIPDEESV